MDGKQMTIVSDDNGEIMFVLVSEQAPTVEAVEAGWRDAAKEQWGIEYRPYDDEEGPDITRGWYKPLPGDEDGALTHCAADDPARESEWWLLELPHEMSRDGVVWWEQFCVERERAPVSVGRRAGLLVEIELDRKRYRVRRGDVTEEQLRDLPAPPMPKDMEIWQECREADDRVDPNRPVTVMGGERFYTTPRNIR